MTYTMGQKTARELLDLESHLMLETNLVGQFNHFARESTNPQLQHLCQNLSRSRMDCFQKLVQHTNSGSLQ
ncbi:hypothetical protein JCM14036_20400 [Desulfotomaculum defluvii]